MSTRKHTSPVWEYFDAPVAIKESGKDVVKVQYKLWNATGPRRRHDQLSFALVGETHGVHTLFWGPSLFKEANDTTNNCSQVFCSTRRHNYKADRRVRGKRSSSVEHHVWWRFPTTSEHRRARVPSAFTHSCHHGLLANLPDIEGGAAWNSHRPDLFCAGNRYLDQPCYTGVPNNHSKLHNSRVEDGKCSAANSRDAWAAHRYPHLREAERSCQWVGDGTR